MPNEFKKVFDELGIEVSLLPVLCAVNRSTLHKYLNGSVTVPASALTLIKMLQFLKVRSPELFREWLILQEFQSLPEHYLEHPTLYKAFEVSTDRMRPVVREYLNGSDEQRYKDFRSQRLTDSDKK